ncbi:MAG TPA: hypothetical protein VJH20_01460 [Candidatus Nanoarchaeia archaeon]|nr:hypothetical protein [Candidatus Pacearchaeota archaeon]HLC73284.1 hypothetical protein [Candidatus Nanoarchaeia archaeon]
MKNTYNSLSVKQRLKFLHRIQIETARKVLKSQIQAKKERARILGIPEKDEIFNLQFNHQLNLEHALQNEDEPRVHTVLEELGQERYDNNWAIYDTDRETRNFDGCWQTTELRWPQHYAGYIESITIYRGSTTSPSSVSVDFVRGKSQKVDQVSLQTEAYKIFGYISSKLRSQKLKE